jgi:hypothetical protein
MRFSAFALIDETAGPPALAQEDARTVARATLLTLKFRATAADARSVILTSCEVAGADAADGVVVTFMPE